MKLVDIFERDAVTQAVRGGKTARAREGEGERKSLLACLEYDSTLKRLQKEAAKDRKWPK